ncbi:MAG: ADYC domain-containing protein [Polyangia bacterium]
MRIRTVLASLVFVATALPARADHQFNGVQMNGVQMSGVTLGNITAEAHLEGDLLVVSMIDVASSCSHSQLQAGGALPASCSPCAQAVDAALSYCGSWMWDASCVSKAQLVCKLSGAQLVGSIFNATLNDGSPVWLKLDGVQNAPAPIPRVNAVAPRPALRFGSDVYWYTFTWKRVPRGFSRFSRWAPICDNYDRDGYYNLAIAAPGTWGDCQGPGCGGRISPYGFVLSCRDKGAIAKCIDRMGYKPWRTATACDRNGNCSDVSLEPFLESCVRMVRADYCGDGVAHTQDGTDIDVYDGVGLQSRDSSVDWRPEALWTPAGAACMTGYRIIDPATGAPYGDVIQGDCYHKPFTSESSGPMCALPTATTWPGTFGGIIGDRSSRAE